jgi:hypothetical protein
VPYLCRFADQGRLHGALRERDGERCGLFALREGVGPGGCTWVGGKAAQAVPFLLSTAPGISPGQPLLVLSELEHDGDPRVKTLAFTRGDIEALLPYLWRFTETGRLHDACPEKEYVGVLLRSRAGRGAGVERAYYHRSCLVPLIVSLPRGGFGERWEDERWITLGEAQARGSDYTCAWPLCGKPLARPAG